MSKSIREKEIELCKKWGYMKELTKNDNLKKEKSYELYEAKEEVYKKWKFFNNFLKLKDGEKNEKENK